MKKQIIIIAALFVVLGAAKAQHDHGAHGKSNFSKKDQSMHAGMKMGKEGTMTYEVSIDFQNQLSEVYNATLKLTDSFISGDAEKISNSSSIVKETLGKVDMSLLKSSEAHMDWMMNLKVMNAALDQISSTEDIKDQRTAYASFNKALYKSIKAFGTTTETIYYQHCPMALDSQGAFWLSNNKEIRNPFFGGSMLSCGSTSETIN